MTSWTVRSRKYSDLKASLFVYLFIRELMSDIAFVFALRHIQQFDCISQISQSGVDDASVSALFAS
jgi:hypothetical protein